MASPYVRATNSLEFVAEQVERFGGGYVVSGMPIPLPIRGGLPGSMRVALRVLIAVAVLFGATAVLAYVFAR